MSNRFEYVLLHVLEKAVASLPRRMVLNLGAGTGLVLYQLGIKKQIVEKNMRHVGLWSSTETRRIIRQLYFQTGRYMADFFRSGIIFPPYTIENSSKLDTLLSRGRGVVVLLAHFGNWELLASIFGKTYPANVIAKPMKNPGFEQWLSDRRQRTGITAIYPKRAVSKSIRVLRNNELLGILIDQNSNKNGTFIPFLGKEANTLRTIAGLKAKTNAALLPMYALMKHDGTYSVILEKELVVNASPDSKEHFISTVQKAHNDVISRWIREYPEHWFGWFHRRFRGRVGYG